MKTHGIVEATDAVVSPTGTYSLSLTVSGEPVVTGTITVTGTSGVQSITTANTVTLSAVPGEIDHDLLAGLSDDDHSQYALLAGRTGGQTLTGDTASDGALTLRGTSDSNRGTIQVNSEMVFGDLTPSPGEGSFLISHSPTYTATGTGIWVDSAISYSPDITVSQANFILSGLNISPTVRQNDTPGFITAVLGLQTSPTVGRASGGTGSVINTTLFQAAPTLFGPDVALGTTFMSQLIGLNFSAMVRANTDLSLADLQNQTAVQVAPTWSTAAAGAIADLGVIRGIHCKDIGPGFFQPSAGTEQYDAYHGLVFENMTARTPSGLNIVVQSLLSAGAKNIFLQNGGGAVSNWGGGDITELGDLSFNAATNTVAGIQNQNLLDKSAAETVSGQWDYSTGLTIQGTPIIMSNLPTSSGSLLPGELWVDQGDNFALRVTP